MPHREALVIGLVVRPSEHGATKIFQRHAEVLAIPRRQCSTIALALEEHAADSGDLCHRNLQLIAPFAESNGRRAADGTEFTHQAWRTRTRQPAGDAAGGSQADAIMRGLHGALHDLPLVRVLDRYLRCPRRRPASTRHRALLLALPAPGARHPHRGMRTGLLR